jgi:hypothetical protein
VIWLDRRSCRWWNIPGDHRVRCGDRQGGAGSGTDLFKIVRVEQAPAVAFEASRTAVRAVRGVLREHGIGDSAGEGSRLSLKTATEVPGPAAPVRRLPVPGRIRGPV